ncbi:MAG: tRNA(fMet)-specific endonuclease VapC [Oceanospirillaceae bacterium]|jgi:tRNA(fMet)-specific endonuclease VapC
MTYLLDASIAVFFLRGKLDLNELILEKGRHNCFISEITVFELRFGAENSANPNKSHKAVNKFINGLTVILIHSIVNAYAKEKVRLRKIGKPMHDEFDNWSNSFGEQIDFSH